MNLGLSGGAKAPAVRKWIAVNHHAAASRVQGPSGW
jgi:hypothetical protein